MIIEWVVVAGIVVGLGLDPLSEATVRSVAGTGEAGFSGDGGLATNARLNGPFDVAYDAQGNLYFSDTFNHRVRRVDAETGTITTVAGNGRQGFSGDGGPATDAALNEPYGVVLDAEGTLYFADRLNYRVRRVDGRTGMITTVAGTGKAQDGGDGGPATEAGLVEPNGVALDGRGTLYIADVRGCRVRAVDLQDGTIRTVAGTGERNHTGDGGPATEASIQDARAVAVGTDGTLYILERNGHTLRKVDPDTGIITSIAGTGRKGYSGDGGPAIEATFNGPKELDVDAEGRVAIVDTENHAIRLYDPRTKTVTTVVGDGRKGGRGDGGPATNARLDRPHGVAFTPEGDLIIGDTNNHRLRVVDLP